MSQAGKRASAAPELYTEQDLITQLMELEYTLPWMRGKDLSTHFGLEYYDQTAGHDFVWPSPFGPD